MTRPSEPRISAFAEMLAPDLTRYRVEAGTDADGNTFVSLTTDNPPPGFHTELYRWTGQRLPESPGAREVRLQMERDRKKGTTA